MKPSKSAPSTGVRKFDTFCALMGENVRRARWVVALTQEAAAAKAGVTFRYYQDIERGQRNPSLRLLLDIAQALRVAVADLTEMPGLDRKATPFYSIQAERPRRGRRRTKVTRSP